MSFENNNFLTVADLIAYGQIREMEEAKELEIQLKASAGGSLK